MGKLIDLTGLAEFKYKILSLVGVNNGIAGLDSSGKIPSAQLPSYVDDVVEYSTLSAFPLTGESGKIYVALDTNTTYRWSGSEYVAIGSSLVLGETSSTAYRGDRGKSAYDHATDSSRLTTAQTSGLYKIATTEEGHVASVTAVQKSDITAFGLVDADQGVANAGKAMMVDSTGLVEPENPVVSDVLDFALDTVTNTSGSYSHTTTVSGAKSTMKPIGIQVGNSAAFNDKITVTINNGSITLSCPDVAGTSTVTVSVLSTAQSGEVPTVTSAEFDVLDGRIGSLNTLTTSAKASTVAAINELNSLKAGLNATQTVTLLANGWSNASPSVQVVTVNGVTTTNNIVVGIGGTLTDAQREAISEASMICTAQATNSITIVAYGTTPTIDVPINVIILG